MNMATKAGPQPVTVPAMPMSAASTKTTRPVASRMGRTTARSSSVREWVDSQTQTPSLTCTGVLGSTEMWCVPGTSTCSYSPKGMFTATETTIFSASSSAMGAQTSSTR